VKDEKKGAALVQQILYLTEGNELYSAKP